MAKRKRMLQPADFECRALAAYALAGRIVNVGLSSRYEVMPDGRCFAVVRTHDVVIAVYEINKSRLRKIDLPTEFW